MGEYKVRYDDNGDKSSYIKSDTLFGMHPERVKYDECIKIGLHSKNEYETFKTGGMFAEMKSLGFKTIAEYETFKAAGFEYYKSEKTIESIKKIKYKIDERVIRENRLATVTYGPDSDGDYKVRYDDNGKESSYIKSDTLLGMHGMHPERVKYDECIKIGLRFKHEYDNLNTSGMLEEMKSLDFKTKAE